MLHEISSRCLKCKVPQCRKHCPVSTPIPDVMRLFEEEKEREAAEILFANNPLSAVCSIVCPHERNCWGHCVLGKKSEPIEFFKIEQYLSGKFLEAYESCPPIWEEKGHPRRGGSEPPRRHHHDILLALQGFRVTLMEAAIKSAAYLAYTAFRNSVCAKTW